MRQRGPAPARIIEPTCGSGAFVGAAARVFPAADVWGLEYQRARYEAELAAFRRDGIRIEFGDAYRTNFAAVAWRGGGPLLVVGNPPWVTAAALGRTGGAPQPPRDARGLRGLAARTGASNFDVAEFLILKLLGDLHAEPLQLALLVKESAARKALVTAYRRSLGVCRAELVRIDAQHWFGIRIAACCLLLETAGASTNAEATPVTIREAFDGPGVASFDPSAGAAGLTAASVFRQGLKHDAAAVFELRRASRAWLNGYGERVEVEPESIFPLRRSGALHAGTVEPTALIVTQRRLGASTAEIETRTPRLWRYLQRHAGRIAARKSSIYRTAPPFAMFGVGPYTFAPWKVAVAGFYERPRFRVLGPRRGKPVLVGDTAYFASFTCEADARAFGALCTSPAVEAELRLRIVRGKRPLTKRLLDELDWEELSTRIEPAPERLRALVRERFAR